MSIAEGILQLLEETARKEQAQRVTVVVLEIGQLASIEVESLRFCFDAVTRDSVAAEARLEIVETPGQGWCLDCNQSVALKEKLSGCPLCGSFRVQVTGGTEMRVMELEVE